MYAHSGPDIKTSLLLIENHIEQHPESNIMVDNAFAWPMAWYFRDHNESYMENMMPEHLQANTRIIQATARKLRMNMDHVVMTVSQHGNTSAASVPLALDVAVRDGRIQRGETVLLEAFGGGFTWGSALLKF